MNLAAILGVVSTVVTLLPLAVDGVEDAIDLVGDIRDMLDRDLEANPVTDAEAEAVHSRALAVHSRLQGKLAAAALVEDKPVLTAVQPATGHPADTTLAPKVDSRLGEE